MHSHTWFANCCRGLTWGTAALMGAVKKRKGPRRCPSDHAQLPSRLPCEVLGRHQKPTLYCQASCPHPCWPLCLAVWARLAGEAYMASCWVLPELRAEGQRCLPQKLHDLLEKMQEQVMQHGDPELRGGDVWMAQECPVHSHTLRCCADHAHEEVFLLGLRRQRCQRSSQGWQ